MRFFHGLSCIGLAAIDVRIGRALESSVACRASIVAGLLALATGFNDATPAVHIPPTAAESAAGVKVKETRYPELDIRRYGAACDYDKNKENNGQAPENATDNLAAFNAAVDVARKKGGGAIRVAGGGDCYVSNTINAKDISHLHFYVERGTTVRSTRYTRSGTLLVLGGTANDGLARPIKDVRIYGGGTLRTFRPDHDTIPVHRANHAYAVGDYVLSTDRNGNRRAYYCKTAGTSGAKSPPDAINGSDTDGTVAWQDADNDNVISITGFDVRVEGMDIPEASGKPITVQVPPWRDVRILNNRIGMTNDKGIEAKGNQAMVGQEAAFGDGVLISGNVIQWAGGVGIDVEQPSFSSKLNRNCRIVGNHVISAGNIIAAAGIHINRCEHVEVRGNKVLRSGGHGFHIRLSTDIAGDLHSENAGLSGVYLQQNSGFSFDLIDVRNAAKYGVAESRNVRGGYVWRLFVDGAINGWRTSGRSGPPPVIANHNFANLSGSRFDGAQPSVNSN
jgi:hypothetical protein